MAADSSSPEDRSRELLKRATSGDSSALEDLVARHLPALRAFVRLRVGPELRARESCSDVVQSVCRELVEDWPGIEYRGEAEFKGWLFTAALNKIRHKARYHHQQQRDVGREASGSFEHELALQYEALGTPSQEAMSMEEIARIEAAFDRLPDDYREVITLARLVGLPQSAIGARMGGRSASAVSMLLGRAMAALGRELQGPSA